MFLSLASCKSFGLRDLLCSLQQNSNIKCSGPERGSLELFLEPPCWRSALTAEPPVAMSFLPAR
eukprot:4550185-Pyramimonas_sp.AAC.1